MAHKGGKGYPKTDQIRKERRERAEAVANESGYGKLSLQQKLEKVLHFISVPGNGEARKQRARLEALIRKSQEPSPAEISVEQTSQTETAEKQPRKNKRNRRWEK